MFRSIASIAVAGLLLVGCGGGMSQEAKEALGINGAPDWVIGMGDGPYSAVGIAYVVDRNLGFAQREAAALARTEIANQIQSSVQTVLDSDTTRQDKSITSQAMEKVKTISSQVLNGSRPTKMWATEDGQQVFVLVKLPMGSVEQIKKVLKTEKIDYNAVEQNMRATQAQAAAQQQAQASEKSKPSSTEEEW